MKLLFKQRMFSWFDSYDIYDEAGATIFTVAGKLAWGHCFKIYNTRGDCLGVVKERIMTLLPKFQIYRGDEETYLGCISKELSLIKPHFNIDFNGWQVSGDVFEWDYTVRSQAGDTVALVSKELLRWTDTYSIDVLDPADALDALMLVLAIDAEKCSRR